MVYAIDFDGTLCENKFPDIGKENQAMIDYVKSLQEQGNQIILWTCRVGNELENAILWCTERGLVFDAYNANLSENIEKFGNDTRKVFAHYYVDDKNLFTPLLEVQSE